MCCGEWQKGREEAVEEWADVGGLLATGSHGDVQAGCCQRACLGP